MFKTRLLSGIVLVILALVLIITGGEVLLFSTLAISCIGMFELYRVFHVEKSILAAVGYIAAIVFYCDLQWNFIPDRMMLFMGFMILLMFVFVFAYPSITPVSTGLSYPMQLIRINAHTNAIMKLKNGPAKTTLIRAQTDFLPKARSSEDSSSSPSIIHAPPNGSSLMEYFVSPFVKPTIAGPSPSENSFTLIPFAFASQKCPSS